MGDIHLPFQDQPVLDLVLNFTKDLTPDSIILGGDVVDVYPLSKFDKKPFTIDTVDDEVELAEKLMKRVKGITEDVTWIGGNHEDRFRKFIWKNGEVFSKLGNKRGLRIADWSFPSLYGLDEWGVKWLEYKAGIDLGKLYVTHGEVATKYAAAKNLDKYRISCITGHNHRKMYYPSSTRAGVLGSWTNGCLCDLHPEYLVDPDWQQCFAVIHVEKDKTFNVQQMQIFKEARGKPYFYYGKDRIRG